MANPIVVRTTLPLLCLLPLLGCTVGTGDDFAPSAPPSTAPSPSPSAGSASSPSSSFTPSPSPSASTTVSPTSHPSTVPGDWHEEWGVELHGSIWDSSGQRVTTAKVHVLSLQPAFRLDDVTVPAKDGHYVIDYVSYGVDLSVSVSAPGYAQRERTVHFLNFQDAGYEMNFGGPATSGDPKGPDYALEPEPSASPSQDGSAAR